MPSQKIKERNEKYIGIRVYFGNNPALLGRLVKLATDHPKVSVSSLITACCACCVDTLEQAFVDGKRRFTMNNKTVEM